MNTFPMILDGSKFSWHNGPSACDGIGHVDDHPVLEEILELGPGLRLVEEHEGDHIRALVGDRALLHHEDLDVVHGPSISFQPRTLHRVENFFQNGLAHVSRCRGVISLASRR